MEYLAFVLWCFAVAAAGGLVGLVLGNLRLPATLLFASSAAAGTGANLVISAVAALAASIAHIRAGRVNWRLFAWMAPPSIVGGVIGVIIGIFYAATQGGPAPTGEPVLFKNPFDRTEVFEFPPGTTQAEARDAVAKALMERAEGRGPDVLKLRIRKAPASAKAH
jgi:hypothetical protein